MADKTKIAWTDHTWNPWMGCHKVSAGCKHCYAETLVQGRMGRSEVWGADGVRSRTSPQIWNRPLRWNREAEEARVPARVFCASLADVFEDYPGPNEWRADVFRRIKETPWLDYQLLTKRPENIARMLPDDWDDNVWGHYPNVWLGTSIEDNRVADRGAILTAVPAQVHFVSYEPAIGPLDELPLDGIEWMIVGGESGPGYRDMDLAWAHDMRRRCDRRSFAAFSPAADEVLDFPDPVAFFFKQNSAPRTEMGIDALGEIVREYPDAWAWDRSGIDSFNESLHEVPEGETTDQLFA